MPSGVSKINYILSKGTFGRNQIERNNYLQNLSDALGNQLENEIVNSLNSSSPSKNKFSQNMSASTNVGGSSTSTGVGKSSTSTKETIGPQVVFQQSTTNSNSTQSAASQSSGSNAANKLSQLTSSSGAGTGSQQSNNISNLQSNTNNTNTAIFSFVSSLFKIGGDSIIDPIKSINGHYYIIQNNKLLFLKPKDITSKIITLSFLGTKKSKDKNPFSSKIKNNNGFTSTQEGYSVSFNNQSINLLIKTYFPKISKSINLNNKFRDLIVSTMIQYLRLNMFNNIYDDYSFSYQTPFDAKQIKETNFGNSLVFDIESQYNFYTDPYESVTNMTFISERVFPNLYVFNTEEVQEEKPSFNLNHATLNRRIKLKDIDDEYYYVNWSNALTKIETPSKLDSISFPLLNTIYQKKDFIALQDKNTSRELFPMYNSIQFSMTNADMNIVENLNDSAFFSPLYNSISSIIPLASSIESISGFFNSAQSNNPTLTDDVTILENTLTVIEKPGLNDILKSDFNQRQQRIISFDLFDYISGSIQNIENYSIPKRKGFDILNYLSEVPEVDDNPIFKIIEPLKIKGQIKNSIEKHSRTYDDFLKNTDLVDSETMFYRISKFRVTVSTNESAFTNGISTSTQTTNRVVTNRQYVQSYTVPNYQDVTKFIQYDTQLKYGNYYEYIVTAYQVVIGSEYQYVNTSKSPNSLSFNAVSCPILKLVETPYFNKVVYIKDSPPIEPDVRLVFYKDVSNVIKFMLNSQVSTKYALPILIEPQDGKIFEDIRIAQQSKKMIRFESEDPPQYFEMFRIENKPKSYSDFTNNLRFKILPRFKSYAGDVVDTIEPNKKYYYIFRVSDVHGHVSNPTNCFEIEVVNDNGKIFPIINIINFEQQSYENKTKQLKRFMHIKPSTIQKTVALKDENDMSSAVNNEIVLGSESDSLWGKKLKVRVKSKLSNKMIDFNISFNKQHIISKDEKDLTS